VTLHRRRLLKVAGVAAALPALSRIAWGQDYPARPIRFIVPLPAGGAADIIVRIMGRWLERLGQQVIVENKPGAGTNVGVQAVVNSAPDGYTLILVGTASAINATLYKQLPFDLLRDIVPVAGLVRFPLVMEVGRAVPTATVAEFIAYAKANPGKINMASSGVGTAPHLAGELFKAITGVDMVHVPYNGEPPAINDLLRGQVHVMFGNVTASIEHIRSGTLRALAVTTGTRAHVLPDVPTVGDTVRGYEASGWFGVGAPRGTQRDIVEKLNRWINAGLADTSIRARIGDLGSAPLTFDPAEFGAFLAEETQKWAKVVRASGAKPI
jgi:tripartite-type tricarboxylate transporter receptor subunit TctC